MRNLHADNTPRPGAVPARHRGNATQDDLILYAHGASAFQLLRAGIELNVFGLLHQKPSVTLDALAQDLALKQEPLRSLLFGLASLGLVENTGHKFTNCQAIDKLFTANEWRMFASLVGIQAYIMYPGQMDYTESIREGRNIGVRRFLGEGSTLYERIKNDPQLHGVFYEYMDAYSEYAIPHFLNQTDFSRAKSILDVGGGGGGNAIAIAKKYPQTSVTLLDLPTTEPVAAKKIARAELSNRVHFLAGDMFAGPFPQGHDAVLFLHQMVIWSMEQNSKLFQKAFESLNAGGQVVVFSSVADDDEKGPVMAALDTVYFKAVAAGGGMIYPWRDYEEAMTAAGFKRIQKIRCNTWTPHGIIIGHKD